jgi:hypothetical protein
VHEKGRESGLFHVFISHPCFDNPARDSGDALMVTMGVAGRSQM